MEITNDYKTKASNDFFIGEYWKNVDFDLPDPLILAGQILRDFFKIPLTVTNTFPDHQKFGYHRLQKACDWISTSQTLEKAFIEQYELELLNYINGKGSELIEKLRQVGINGFGYESMCIHLDTRPQGYDPIYKTSTNHTDKYGGFTAFAFSCHYASDGSMIIDINKAI
jgi:hypothetical protein